MRGHLYVLSATRNLLLKAIFKLTSWRILVKNLLYARFQGAINVIQELAGLKSTCACILVNDLSYVRKMTVRKHSERRVTSWLTWECTTARSRSSVTLLTAKTLLPRSVCCLTTRRNTKTRDLSFAGTATQSSWDQLLWARTSRTTATRQAGTKLSFRGKNTSTIEALGITNSTVASKALLLNHFPSLACTTSKLRSSGVLQTTSMPQTRSLTRDSLCSITSNNASTSRSLSAATWLTLSRPAPRQTRTSWDKQAQTLQSVCLCRVITTVSSDSVRCPRTKCSLSTTCFSAATWSFLLFQTLMESARFLTKNLIRQMTLTSLLLWRTKKERNKNQFPLPNWSHSTRKKSTTLCSRHLLVSLLRTVQEAIRWLLWVNSNKRNENYY